MQSDSNVCALACSDGKSWLGEHAESEPQSELAQSPASAILADDLQAWYMQVDVQLADLVSRLLMEDAGARLDAAQALAHPFFAAETPLHWMLHSASVCRCHANQSMAVCTTLHTASRTSVVCPPQHKRVHRQHWSNCTNRAQ